MAFTKQVGNFLRGTMYLYMQNGYASPEKTVGAGSVGEFDSKEAKQLIELRHAREATAEETKRFVDARKAIEKRKLEEAEQNVRLTLNDLQTMRG